MNAASGLAVADDVRGAGHAGERRSWDEVELLVVGAGTMGASLAQAYAQSGFVVGLIDVSDEILSRARATIDAELSAARGRIFSDEDITRIRGRILTTTDYAEACRGGALELVIEAATERLDVKKKIFAELDRLCRPGVVLATNSSSLDVNVLARVTSRPDRVLWMHYFYLPHKNRAGEYAGADSTSAESMTVARRFLKLGGKIPTLIRGSRHGGAADIIFVALLHEATRMVEEGQPLAAIEEAGKRAYNIPMGFLTLMDETGLPVGLHAMRSFSNPDPDDPVRRVYGNFYEPRANYVALVERLGGRPKADDVRWIMPGAMGKGGADPALVETLRRRFLAVGFMTGVEVVEAGLITPGDLEVLCQNAFLWREGPYAIMNRVGVAESFRMVTERAALARQLGHDFPVPRSLEAQAAKGAPWPLDVSPVLYDEEEGGAVARITISSPRTANAMDNEVFEAWDGAFRRADADPRVKTVIFDSAPIKTFIAGASVPGFVQRIRENDIGAIVRDTARWQDVLFGSMTGRPGARPRIAIVDGQTLGGGVEVALAFAADPDTVVIATERTSYTLPETRLGIYPGLRGTLLLPQVIHRATGDAELALAMSRYYMLAGGSTTSSPRMLRHLGLVHLVVPARRRDEAAAAVARAMARKGAALTREEIARLGIRELPLELTAAEREEIRLARIVFLKPDLVPALYAYGRGWTEPHLAGEARDWAVRVARRVAANSPHAVAVTDRLINRGFAGYLAGRSTGELARWELDTQLAAIFEHPDAEEGLSALLERRFPNFNRRYPL